MTIRHASSLTAAEVTDFRQRHADGYAGLADRFGLNEWTASRVALNQTRQDVPMPPRWRADCMTDTEWDTWHDLKAQYDPTPRPCCDCPTSFAAAMAAIGRCNGEPEG